MMKSSLMWAIAFAVCVVFTLRDFTGMNGESLQQKEIPKLKTQSLLPTLRFVYWSPGYPLCAIRLATSVKESYKRQLDRCLFVVSAYTPTDCSSDTIKDKFCDTLDTLLRRAKSSVLNTDVMLSMMVMVVKPGGRAEPGKWKKFRKSGTLRDFQLFHATGPRKPRVSKTTNDQNRATSFSKEERLDQWAEYFGQQLSWPPSVTHLELTPDIEPLMVNVLHPTASEVYDYMCSLKRH
ncbi:hypothetical protein T265_05418 [Opisthorchis viverrini]|uniref:Uncharacterized protein n=1 Tax=Opisthorchis viverrini TaxID=6198 RepID=A0A074ZW62_OPIVI|nr:hypothetical protein T265_05418 [Opisthorchis viverrini]KER27605.1 hypothetical protein T265_05418 [Opisthorchis viverrini]